MKNLIFIMCIATGTICAQNIPYRGGKGDGYASNKLVLKNIALSIPIQYEDWKIYKSESSLIIQNALAFREIEIYNANGIRIHHQYITEGWIQIPILSNWENQYAIIALKGKDGIIYKKMVF